MDAIPIVSGLQKKENDYDNGSKENNNDNEIIQSEPQQLTS
jgi:hypothetical protein